MPSIVWGRDPQEAFEEPYEYDAQEQYVREASALLRKLYGFLNSDNHRYTGADCSAAKAVWLLVVDALDALVDALDSLRDKRHRISGRLFRDVVETLDLAKLFHSRSQVAERLLVRWYADEVVPHRSSRDHIKESRGDAAASESARRYARLSRFTHRTYHAIMDGYILGAEDRPVHDRTASLYEKEGSQTRLGETILTPPQTVSAYFAAHASFVVHFTEESVTLGILTTDQVNEAFARSLEHDTVQRRFLPRRWLKQLLQARPPDAGSEGGG